MPDCLFVYGLLLPELAPPKLAEVIDALEPVGRGQVSGRLYDLGPYPGAIVESESGSSISGMVFRLPPTTSVLALFDRFEGVHPTSPADGLYVRRTAEARLEDGQELEVWIYQYNQDVSEAEYLPDGDYRNRQ